MLKYDCSEGTCDFPRPICRTVIDNDDRYIAQRRTQPVGVARVAHVVVPRVQDQGRRPHRGISQEKLPLYLGFFEFVHNARRRGKALLGALLAVLVTP